TYSESGLAHALEHMFFKGTAKRGVGDIAKETKANGGYLNAHTIYDNTTYFTVLPSSGFVKGLEIQADAYANSVIDGRELAREMEVIIQEAKRKADNPPAVATETLYELLYDAHRMRRWRIGREPGLRALTREMMYGFYRNFYRPGNTILSIAGDDDEIPRVRRIFEARWARRLETAEGRANYLAEWEALGGWQLGDDYFKRYMSTTPDDVQLATRDHLAEEKAAALIYRPESAPV